MTSGRGPTSGWRRRTRARGGFWAESRRSFNHLGIFPNEAAITRLVGALLLEQSDEWALQRRYMQLEGLQTLTDNQPARLSAVVR